METLLNIIAVISTSFIVEGFFYFVLSNTIGRIPFINKLAFKDYLFWGIGIVFILFFFTFYIPH